MLQTISSLLKKLAFDVPQSWVEDRKKIQERSEKEPSLDNLLKDKAGLLKNKITDRKVPHAGLFLRDLHAISNYVGTKIKEPLKDKEDFIKMLNQYVETMTSRARKGDIEIKVSDVTTLIDVASNLKDDGTLLSMLDKVFTAAPEFVPKYRKAVSELIRFLLNPLRR